MRDRFDASYYRRFYGSPKTRVYGPEEVHRLASGVTGFIAWFGGPLDTVLDIGAGTGLWGAWFGEHHPHVRVHSVDISPYACATYGHEHADITRWRTEVAFDLVLCQGVLPYIDDALLGAAIDNIAVMTRGFLYLEAMTAQDLECVCDRSRTDTSMNARPGRVYRALLAKHFVTVGCGLYYAKGGPLLFYELETPE